MFLLIAFLLLGQVPIVAAFAASTNRYDFTEDNVSYENLSGYFKNYSGCMVLYDKSTNHYDIYNRNKSTLRVSPDSTFKIYSALFALQEKTISPNHSEIKWNHTVYPFSAWNSDQDLQTAMHNSVNWYFQALDRKTGISNLEKYYMLLGYGNCDLSGGVNSYWSDSSLLVSPVEQVQSLMKLYDNTLRFSSSNVAAVKNSLFISANNEGSLFGKTGTGIVNQKETNGWFVGFIQKSGDAVFFATNIQGSDHTTGETAAKITLAILNSKKIY